MEIVATENPHKAKFEQQKKIAKMTYTTKKSYTIKLCYAIFFVQGQRLRETN